MIKFPRTTIHLRTKHGTIHYRIHNHTSVFTLSYSFLSFSSVEFSKGTLRIVRGYLFWRATTAQRWAALYFYYFCYYGITTWKTPKTLLINTCSWRVGLYLLWRKLDRWEGKPSEERYLSLFWSWWDGWNKKWCSWLGEEYQTRHCSAPLRNKRFTKTWNIWLAPGNAICNTLRYTPLGLSILHVNMKSNHIIYHTCLPTIASRLLTMGITR